MSEKIEWSDDYSIGVAKIDKQHKELINLFERLRLSITRGLQNPEVGFVLKDLVKYTQTHFNDEEEIMREIDYKEFDRHVKLHRDLLNNVASILKNLKTDDTYTGLDLMKFLKSWIYEHMIREDSKIAVAYKEAVSNAAKA